MKEKVEIVNGQYVKLNYTMAGLESRIFAVIIDRTIQLVLIILVFSFVSNQGYFSTREFLSVCLYVIIYLMNLMTEYLWHGKTIGKWAMKIKVVTNECQPPCFQQCFLRWILYPIDEMIVGFVLISKHNQRLGDMTSGCYVVKEKSQKDVKVSISDDYRYIEDDYEPIYGEEEIKVLSDEDEQLILKALYHPNYVSQQSAYAKRILKQMDVEKQDLSDKDFLIQVYNDYNYWKIQ